MHRKNRARIGGVHREEEGNEAESPQGRQATLLPLAARTDIVPAKLHGDASGTELSAAVAGPYRRVRKIEREQVMIKTSKDLQDFYEKENDGECQDYLDSFFGRRKWDPMTPR